jgi:hypothetical protein
VKFVCFEMLSDVEMLIDDEDSYEDDASVMVDEIEASTNSSEDDDGTLY